MFAYCGNNPVSRKDDGGEFWNFVVGGVIGALVGGVSAAVSSYVTTGAVDWGSVALGVATGTIGGLIGASGMPALGQAVASGLLSAVNNVGNALITGNEIEVADVAIDFAIGAASSLIGSLATKKLASAAKSTISKGINRVVSGLARLDSGSRYWKGAVKRGIETISKGVAQLNFAQGAASVIGSEVAGILSLTKTIVSIC